MRVLVIAEYYPRAGDSARGIWAHRQALAAREAGAEVRVLVLHRPIPPLSALRRREVGRALGEVRQPGADELDGIGVEYLRYLSPPRASSYQSWGAWAAPWLARRLSALRRAHAFDLVHAHYAVPAGDATRRAAADVPLVVSVHGHDVYGEGSGGPAVRTTLAHARLVLANSAGTASRCSAAGARATRVVHLGTDLPPAPSPEPSRPTLVTVGNLVARKRHADVVAALPALRSEHPELRYVIVGDGPEREPLRRQARALGVADAVDFRGRVDHDDAVAAARSASLFVLPSIDEAFGVAYIEAMAGGVPALACAGEAGPEELAASGGGIALVPARDPGALATTLSDLLRDGSRRRALGAQARATVASRFTWTACGEATVAAYAEALASPNPPRLPASGRVP
jgi:teichuronic acid biosynthesis glycosyltransferase TuaC